MDRESLAYMEGFREVLQAHGVEKQASDAVLKKVAQYGGLSQYDIDPSMYSQYANYVTPEKTTLQKALPWVLGGLALAGLGTVAYQAGKTGDPTKSWVSNSLDYMKRVGNKVVRKSKPHSWYNYNTYFDNFKPSTYAIA